MPCLPEWSQLPETSLLCFPGGPSLLPPGHRALGCAFLVGLSAGAVKEGHPTPSPQRSGQTTGPQQRAHLQQVGCVVGPWGCGAVGPRGCKAVGLWAVAVGRGLSSPLAVNRFQPTAFFHGRNSLAKSNSPSCQTRLPPSHILF